jgi:hypothetical protein
MEQFQSSELELALQELKQSSSSSSTDDQKSREILEKKMLPLRQMGGFGGGRGESRQWQK